MLPLVGFGGVICSSFRSRGGVGGCFARVCEADGAWSNIFPLLDSANVHFSLRQSPNAPTLVYIYTHISLCGFFMYRLCTFAVLLRFTQRMKATVMVPWMHHHANAAVMAEWRHSSVGEIWCCRSCTWSVVYFFQEQWKCSQTGGGGGVGKILKQLSWIGLPWRGGKRRAGWR